MKIQLPAMPQVPKAFMQGLIALLLIGNFTFMVWGPTIWGAQYKSPDDAMKQTLVNLVILAVGYYLGSSQGSARKDEISAAQTDKAMAALTPPAPPTPPLLSAPAPGVAPEPVAVTIKNDAPVPVVVEPPASPEAPAPAVPK